MFFFYAALEKLKKGTSSISSELTNCSSLMLFVQYEQMDGCVLFIISKGFIHKFLKCL